MIEGIRIDPKLAIVKMKLHAREYFWIMVPAKDTVVGYSPAMLNPKPMIPTRISGVDVLNKSRMKKPTSPCLLYTSDAADEL